MSYDIAKDSTYNTYMKYFVFMDNQLLHIQCVYVHKKNFLYQQVPLTLGVQFIYLKKSIYNYKITLNNEKNKITPTKYSLSDNIYFKNLINNSSNSNENILADKKKENTNADYYTERDDSNFERIKQFPPQTSDEFIKKKNDNYVISNNYKVSDVSAFEQIIKSNNIQKNTSTSVNNRNINS